jgi:hypothetical protein
MKKFKLSNKQNKMERNSSLKRLFSRERRTRPKCKRNVVKAKPNTYPSMIPQQASTQKPLEMKQCGSNVSLEESGFSSKGSIEQKETPCPEVLRKIEDFLQGKDWESGDQGVKRSPRYPRSHKKDRLASPEGTFTMGVTDLS